MSDMRFQRKLSRRSLLQGSIRLGLSLGASAPLLQACGGFPFSTADMVRNLSFATWASADSNTRLQLSQAIPVFEQESHVKVDTIGFAFNREMAQIKQLIAAGAVINGMELSGNDPFMLASMGALTDLGPFVSPQWHADAYPISFSALTYHHTQLLV